MQGGFSPAKPTSPEEPARMAKDYRRRSADVGGLHLATRGHGQGQGWMGGDAAMIQTIFAEMLSDLYRETLNSVNDNSINLAPASLPVAVKARLIRSLDRWHFEPQQLPDEEVLACTLILFETLFRVEGMAETIPIEMAQITEFIYHLRRIYRYENTYHNFEHALDVLQATHCYLKSAGMVPSPAILLEENRLFKPAKEFNGSNLVSCLGLRELFILYVAAIGHDVGHPGFSNMFMKNANTPLSLVFDHSSALEQMHYQLLLRVMRHHGLGILLDDPKHGYHVRDILRSSVIATDMSVHKDFMTRFKRITDGEMGTICQRQTIICQAILKNADISNPSRPFYVSTRWAKALMQEWTAQANLEHEYDMAPTVMSSSDPLKEVDSQVFFITHFVRPMLELTVKAIPEMSCYLTHCKTNLKTWGNRKLQILAAREQAALARPSILDPNSPPTPPSVSASSSSSSSSGTTVSIPQKTQSLPKSPSRPLQGPPLSAASGISRPSLLFPPPPTSPRSQADSFTTVFPLTLPTYPPRINFLTESVIDSSHQGHHHTNSSLSSMSTSLSPSCSVSEHESNPPDSPSGDSSDTSGSPSVSSPVTEASSNGAQGFRCHPSCCSLASTSSSGVSRDKTGLPSVASSVNGYSTDSQHLTTPHAAIRAASRLGSLRQRRNKDSPMGSVPLKDIFTPETDNGQGADAEVIHAPFSMAAASVSKSRKGARNSWCAGMNGFNPSGLSNLFQQYEQQQQEQLRSPLSTISSANSSVVGSPAIPTSATPVTFSIGTLNESTSLASSTTPTSKRAAGSSSSFVPSSPVSPRTVPAPSVTQFQQTTLQQSMAPAIPLGRHSSSPVKLHALQVSSP